jgi:anti-sigma factor RsiW
MKCEGYQEQLSALIDMELEDGEAEELFRHMSGCITCRSVLRSQLALRFALREDVPPVAPEDLDEKVFAAVRSQRQRESDRPAIPATIWRRRLSLRVPVVAVAACLLIVGSVVLSTIWAESNQTADVRQVQTVFLTAVPAVEVRAYTMQPMTTIQ